MAASKLTQGATAPDKKQSQGAWEQAKVAAPATSIIPILLQMNHFNGGSSENEND